MKWFYQTDNREVGPLTETALKELTASGVINEETPVRREDSAEWQPCSILFSQTANSLQQPEPEPCPPPIEDANSPQSKIRRKKARKRKEAIVATLIAMTLLAVGAGVIFFSTGRGAGKGRASQQTKLFRDTSAVPFVNDLGMKFVPVPIKGGKTDGQSVLFCVWETRHKDFKAFVDATGYDATKEEDGKAMEFDWNYEASRRRITGDHPVSYVNWEDAQAFCQWLTKKERDAGTITANHKYRLPTDHEWSCAVGIGSDENASDSPWNKSRKISAYPWGSNWPPPPGVGNYGGQESFIYGHPDLKQDVLEGYSDDFPNTAPVGSFRPNDYGIYDLSGNVYEWCEDFHQPYTTARVLRGGSWLGGSREGLLSSSRAENKSDNRDNILGFRCVLGHVNDRALGSGDPLLEDDPQNQVVYGLKYKNGDGVIASEHNAILMFRKAALQGNSDGQLQLGMCYALGEGIEGDPKIAVEWYLKSAEQGNRDAQELLGNFYHMGVGVEKNLKTAAKWYSKSALQDGLDGQVSLAHMYMNGDGVPKDPVIAYMLFVLGNPTVTYSKNKMEKIKEEILSADEISLSHKMIERWKSDPNSRPSLLESRYERINTDRAKSALSDTDVSEAVAMAKRLPDKPSVPSTFIDATVASERSTEKKEPTVASHSPESVKSLAALQAFKSGTLDEAKECIRQLDEELKNDAENTRIKLVKSTIMDVFRAEASLVSARNGTKDAEKEYKIKIQNLQIASRPSPLTGRVDTSEALRIKREADAIKANFESRVTNAKSNLKKTIVDARRAVPAPDNLPLSRVWSQIESRNNL